MRIKVKPEDFIVKEKLKLQPSKRGKYVLYRIEKMGWSTLELLSHLRINYGLEIKHAGHKDRRSLSVQYGTSLQDVETIKGNGFLVQKIGYWWSEIEPSDIESNQFLVKIRDVEKPSLLDSLKKSAEGFPNYYDEQRFGWRTKEGLVGELLLKGETEKALFLYMTTIRKSDSPSMKEIKKYVKENWRNWESLESLVPVQFKPVFNNLKEGKDFLKAWSAFPRGILTIILTGVQSWYWNLLLSRRLKKESKFFIKISGVRFACNLNKEGEELPLLGNDDHSLQIYSRILKEKGIGSLGLKELGFKFKSTMRKTFVRVENFEGEVMEDELYPGKKAIFLRFSLPVGSYATTLIKVGEAYNKALRAGLPGFEPGSDG